MREIEITRRRFIWASAVFAALQALPSTVRARAATVLGSIPGRPTGTTVAINLLGAATGKAYVEYGYAPGKYTAKSAVTTVSAKEPAVIELSKLKANSVVYYRTRFATTDNTFTAQSESSVALQRKPGTPFSFTVQGDSHPERAGNMFNAELYMRTVANIASTSPAIRSLIASISPRTISPSVLCSAAILAIVTGRPAPRSATTASTAITPGTSSAGAMSMDFTFACACGERTNTACVSPCMRGSDE